ncbi:MAG: DUF2225 domain-containing protein [Planctomycetota bacterium]
MAARPTLGDHYIMRRVRPAAICLIIACITSGACFGVLVRKDKASCPLCDSEVAVLRIGSYGSYIYDRECKYDLIYFPYDDPRFVWMCAHCGYAQVAKHFNDLGQKEKKRLRDFLSTRWEPISPNDISIDTPNDTSAMQIRFDQATLVNEFLGKDDDFWAWFNRVLIYHYRLINPEKAKALASVEIELLQKNRGDFEAPAKNRAYLLGEYNRLIGNSDLARKHFADCLKVDMVSETRNMSTILIVTNFAVLILLLSLWIKRAFTRNARILCTIGGILVFAFCSFGLYLVPKLIPQQEYLNNYYNEITCDRIKLLSTQPERPATK